jgi:hypothetical protein
LPKIVLYERCNILAICLEDKSNFS